MSDTYNFKFEEQSVYANVVSLIPKHNNTHLDLGCGFGAIAGVLRDKGCTYIGCDANARAVANLQEQGFLAYSVDLADFASLRLLVQSLISTYQICSVSLIDVIEHLDDPLSFLTLLDEILPQNCYLILSVPNFSHYDVATGLLLGHWDERESGILDFTHRQVFTERKLFEVTRQAGWGQIAAADYKLELSEQYEKSFFLHNRDVGFGGLLREMIGKLNPAADTYQFVRSYSRVAKAKSLPVAEKKYILTVIYAGKASNEFNTSAKDVQFIFVDPDGRIKQFASDFTNCTFINAIQELNDLDLGDYIIVNPKGDFFSEDYTDKIRKASGMFNALPVLNFIQGENGAVNVLPLSAMKSFPSYLDAKRLFFPSSVLKLVYDLNQLEFALSKQCFEFCFLYGVAEVGLDSDVIMQEVTKTEQISDEKKIHIANRLNDLCLSHMNLSVLGQGATADDLKQRVAELEYELWSTRQSFSWKITRPLRFVRSSPARMKALLRRLYQKYPPLARVWHFTKVNLTRAREYFINLPCSENENLRAINELSARRVSMSSPVGFPFCPEIDLSVVTYNSEKWLSRFMECLIAQNYPCKKMHLKFVDNSSTDNTLQMLKDLQFQYLDEFASISIQLRPNLGFGAGHDAAIRDGSSEYILVTNVDLEFEEDSLTNLIKAVACSSNTNIASWELRQIPYEHPKYYDPVTLETNWSSHACILIKREAYVRVGGYEHRIFMYAEDVELSYRFRSFGYHLKYCPSAVVRHFSYEQAGQVKPLQFSGSTLGNAYLRLRYGKLKDRLGIVPLYFALIARSAPYVGARKDVLNNVAKIFKNLIPFLTGRGDHGVAFPFRYFDYELIRDGAFYTIRRCVEGPLVSVVIRTYKGRDRFLREAIQSVLNQTYNNIEIIVVEDGGSEMSNLVDSFNSTKIKYFSCNKVGRSVTGNVGLANSSGAYAVFLDDDDLFFADHIETSMRVLLDDPTLDAVYSLAMQVYTSINQLTKDYIECKFDTPASFKQEFDYETLLDHNFIPIQSIVFKRELFVTRGGFEEDMDQLEDWNLWIRYAYKKKFKYIPKTTSLFRIPAEDSIRLSRHLKLHEAYHSAKSRALERIN